MNREGFGPPNQGTNMIDLILFFFWVATFAGGFWCGKKYGTLGAMFNSAMDAMKNWTK